MFSDALAWLDRHQDRPFFLYLQTIDPHVTYSPPLEHLRPYHPEPYDGPLGPSLDGFEQAAISQGKKPASAADVRWMRALYDGEISYHDEQLGRFLEALSATELLDQTLFIVTNDHGEEIADHGRHGHGHTLYQELIRSPLTIRYPPVFAPGPGARHRRGGRPPAHHRRGARAASPARRGWSLAAPHPGRPPARPSPPTPSASSSTTSAP